MTSLHGGDPFAGGGEMRRLCRSVDWSSTALGPVASWSPALRAVVRTALEAPFPINLWCGAELVLIYNDAYREVLGTKHPAALGRPGAEVWSEIWHLIEPMFTQIRSSGEAFYSDDAPFVIDRGQPAVAPSQPNAWFTFSLSAVRDDEGAVVAYLNIVSETTGRVQAGQALQRALGAAERAEAQLREMFAQAPAFMALLRGREHVFEYVNDAYYQLVGHRELIGLPAFEALPEVRGQGFETLLDNVRESGEPYVGREVAIMVARTPGAEAEQRYVDFVYYPVREADGPASGVVAHGYDVTDHVRAREEADRARAEAELASQAKSQFLANMSHEIRTPINAVVGYADLLDAEVAGELSSGQQAYVQRIRASSRHLLSLVTDVLDLAKIEAGEMLVRTEPTPLHPIVTDALEMVAPEAVERGLQLVPECDAAEELQFAGDADRARQILLNLLSNALKFTPGGGSIAVRCRRIAAAAPDAALPETGPWVGVEVEDTGPGIEAAQLQRIFSAFVQADSSLTRAAEGTGLGLTISRRLARMMNGDLTVRSEPGVGSCFTIWLPSVQQQALPVRPVRSTADADPHAAVGDVLLQTAEPIEQQVVARLRQDLPELTARLDDAHVADHMAAFVAALARSVAALGAAAQQQDVLEDGAAVRAVLAQRHGSQRRRLGWSPADVELEYRILGHVLESQVQREIPGVEIAAALDAMRRLLREAQADSSAAWGA